MGKFTKNYRQSKSSLSGDRGARTYGQIQRGEPWHKKVWNYFKKGAV